MLKCDAHSRIGYVDAHVHYYDCFQLEQMLLSALRNLRIITGKHEFSDALSCLIVADVAGQDFNDVIDRGTTSLSTRWSIEMTDQGNAWIVRSNGEPAIVLIRGRQIITTETLEVLSVGMVHERLRTVSLSQTVDQITESGAIAILPWGMGKWWFRRGQVVRRFLRSSAAQKCRDAGQLFLGDNSGRPPGCQSPVQWATQYGLFVLPGSDPLPFADQHSNIGRFGFVSPKPIQLDSPFDSIKKNLLELHSQPTVFGQRVGLVSFLRSQGRLWARRVTS